MGNKFKEARVLCGEEKIAWGELIIACARMKMSDGEWRRSSPAVDNALMLDALSQHLPDPPDSYPPPSKEHSITCVLDDVERFRGFQATDPRDKIFALSGMQLLAPDQAPVVPVMYEASKEEVFTFFAIRLLDWTKDLHILRHIRKCPRDMIAPSVMPSWVPDWSHGLYERALPSKKRHKPSLIPWWSVPLRSESSRTGYPRGEKQEVLRQRARDALSRKGTVKFNAMPAWVLDTIPANMAESMREVFNNPNIISCVLDEGDVMDGEVVSIDEALARRETANE